MNRECKHYDEELDCCKLLSDWSEAMPVLQPCIDGPCTEYEMAADDKQIEEIVKILFAHISVNSTDDDIRRCANHLYHAGFRKQSEAEWNDDCRCSICDWYMPFDCNGDAFPTLYCPTCGAKMKGG